VIGYPEEFMMTGRTFAGLLLAEGLICCAAAAARYRDFRFWKRGRHYLDCIQSGLLDLDFGADYGRSETLIREDSEVV
jgi:hypothetical protein